MKRLESIQQSYTQRNIILAVTVSMTIFHETTSAISREKTSKTSALPNSPLILKKQIKQKVQSLSICNMQGKSKRVFLSALSMAGPILYYQKLDI